MSEAESTSPASQVRFAGALPVSLMELGWLALLGAASALLGTVIEADIRWPFEAGVAVAAAVVAGIWGYAVVVATALALAALLSGSLALVAGDGLLLVAAGGLTLMLRSKLQRADVCNTRFMTWMATTIAVASVATALVTHWGNLFAVAVTALTGCAAAVPVAAVVVSVAAGPARQSLERAVVAVAFVAVPSAIVLIGQPSTNVALGAVVVVGAAAMYFAGRGRVVAAWSSVALVLGAATLTYLPAHLPQLLVLVLAIATTVILVHRVRQDRLTANQAANQRLFETMMRFLPVGIFRIDTVGSLRYANPTFKTLTGLDSSGGWLDAVLAEDRARIEAAWRSFTAGHAAFEESFRVAPLGNVRWIEVRVTPEYQRGNVAGYIGTVTDITSQHIAEERRLRTEAQSQAVLDNAVDAIITIDAQGMIRSFNKAAQRTFGYAPDEILGRSVNLLMPQPHRDHHDQYIQNYLRTGQAKIIGIGRELEARLKDGREIPIYLAVSEVMVGEQRHFTGVVRDISKERAAAEEIRRQHEQLSVTIQNAPMGIATYRFGSAFEATNRAFQLTTGFDEAQLRNRTMLDLVHPDDAVELERLMQQSAAGLVAQFSMRVRLVRADHSVVHVATHHAVTHDAEGNPDLVILQMEDLTNEMQAIEAEREHREKLTHVARLSTLGEMTAGIAHEINQPLTAIAMYAQSGVRMLDSGNPNPARLREALVKLNAQSLRAGAVIDRIQRLVRNHDSVREYVDLNDLVYEILRLAEGDARINDIEIETDLADAVPPVRADPIQIQQVLLNLVRNGIDAMRSVNCAHGNKIVITTRVTPEGVHVAVVDSGTGVAPEFAEQLFTPFATTKESGMGMGLSICRSIIEDHGGRMGYSNNADHGATFYFGLPRESRDDD